MKIKLTLINTILFKQISGKIITIKTISFNLSHCGFTCGQNFFILIGIFSVKRWDNVNINTNKKKVYHETIS